MEISDLSVGLELKISRLLFDRSRRPVFPLMDTGFVLQCKLKVSFARQKCNNEIYLAGK
jgi:hypothetical protein